VKAYPHLHLKEWPFRDVPDESFCSFIADRSQLVSDINTLLRNLSRRSTSSMHLMWAWFGAGKTHTLYHIEHLCKTDFKNIIPIYIEFPRSVKSFLDIYKSFIAKLDMDFVDEVYVEVFGDSNKERIQKDLKYDYPDLASALKLHFMGGEQQQDIAVRWLRAECKELRLLKAIGVTKPIQDTEDSIKIISWLIRLLRIKNIPSENQNFRIIWMIDEFQRLEKCRVPVQEEINGCLHSVFNRCPDSLSIIISFSGHPEEKKLPSWLSREVKDRIGIEKVLLLPPLRSDEAFKFIKDVFRHFRSPESDISNVLFPFTKESVNEVIKIIEGKKDELKPRRIMQYFKAVLEEAEPQIEKGNMQIIDINFVKQILKDRLFLDQED
jgi:hypothetical protein